MNIRDIPHKDIEAFLNVNKVKLSNEQENYDNAWKLMKKPNTIYSKKVSEYSADQVPSSITLWMMAYNLVAKKVNIPHYTKLDISKMSENERTALSKTLEMKSNYKGYIIDILKYLGKLDENPNCGLFDEALYDIGHRWTWFWIKRNNIVAVFRLHHDEQISWDMIEFLNCPQTRKLNYGEVGKIRHDTGSAGGITIGKPLNRYQTDVYDEFKWLDDFISVYREAKETFDSYSSIEFFTAL